MSMASKGGHDGVLHGADNVRPWAMPELEPGQAQTEPAAGRPRPPTAAEIEALREAAQQEGFAVGRREGLAAGAADIEQERLVLKALAAQLAKPLAELDVEVERALANLALSLSRRIVGREIQADPEALQSLVHQVVGHLGTLSSTVDIRLNPDDLKNLKAIPDLDPAWNLQADPKLNRGDLILRHGDTHVDARLTERVSRLAADMLDGF